MATHVTLDLSYQTQQRIDKFLQLFGAYVEVQKELLAFKKERPDDTIGGDFDEEDESKSYKHPISGKETFYEQD